MNTRGRKAIIGISILVILSMLGACTPAATPAPVEPVATEAPAAPAAPAATEAPAAPPHPPQQKRLPHPPHPKRLQLANRLQFLSGVG